MMTASFASSAAAIKVAVVTGANKGIGYCIAEQLIAKGEFGRIILACRDKTRGMEAVAKLGPKTEFAQLDISDKASIDAFVSHMENNIGRCDGLINNAGIAFKPDDPTPPKAQVFATFNVNYFGTADLSDKMIPLLRRTGETPFITTQASMLGKLNQIKNKELKAKFAADTLTREELDKLVNACMVEVATTSAVGSSKLALIAYCKLRAREEIEAKTTSDGFNMIQMNWCCPGFCNTDMTEHKGPRSPEDGAKNAVMLSPPTNDMHGIFIQNGAPSRW